MPDTAAILAENDRVFDSLPSVAVGAQAAALAYEALGWDFSTYRGFDDLDPHLRGQLAQGKLWDLHAGALRNGLPAEAGYRFAYDLARAQSGEALAKSVQVHLQQLPPAQSKYLLGLAAADDHEYARACTLVNEALAMDPGFTEARRLLGSLQFRLNQGRQAAETVSLASYQQDSSPLAIRGHAKSPAHTAEKTKLIVRDFFGYHILCSAQGFHVIASGPTAHATLELQAAGSAPAVVATSLRFQKAKEFIMRLLPRRLVPSVQVFYRRLIPSFLKIKKTTLSTERVHGSLEEAWADVRQQAMR